MRFTPWLLTYHVCALWHVYISQYDVTHAVWPHVQWPETCQTSGSVKWLNTVFCQMIILMSHKTIHGHNSSFKNMYGWVNLLSMVENSFPGKPLHMYFFFFFISDNMTQLDLPNLHSLWENYILTSLHVIFIFRFK